MPKFLLVYNKREGKLLSSEEFPDDSGQAALAMRFELERDNASNLDIEIVVLEGPSLEALEQTHGRYFKDLRQLAS